MKNTRLAMLLMAVTLQSHSVRAAGTEALISVRNMDADAEEELVLENAFFRLVIKPSAGGAGISLKPKPSGTEMLVGGGKRAGLFGNGIWQQGPVGDYAASHTYVIEENTPEAASLTLTCTGSTKPILNWVRIKRTITIYADRPTINVRVEIENIWESMKPFRVGLWVHNLIAAEAQETTYFIPRTDGVLRLPITSVANTQQYWHYEMARGWLAALADDGTGLAFRMDYPRLMCGYQWMKSRTITLEWLYRSEEIPNGKTAVFEYQVVPFAGLSRVDGVGDTGVVGAIVFPATPVPGKKSRGEIRLLGDPGKVALAVTWRHGGDGQWQALGTGDLDLAGGTTATYAFPFTAESEGLYGLRCVVTRDGKRIGILERSLKIGRVTGRYTLAPESAPVDDVKERWITSIALPNAAAVDAKATLSIKDFPEDVPVEMKVPTPHVPWARPYHLGKTRALVLVQTQVARDVVEFAQRLDLDYRTVTIGGAGYKTPAALINGWNDAAAMLVIKNILANEPLDVIVIRAPWHFFNDDVRKLIIQRVKAGAGLVYVSYDYHEEEKKDPRLFELVSQGPYQKNYGGKYVASENRWVFPHVWKPLAEHYLAGALPWEAMTTPCHVYEQTTGTPVIGWDSEEAGETVPMVVVSEYGKGRVVCLNYNPAWFPGRCDQLVPDMYQSNSYTAQSRFYQPAHDFHIQEYSFALLSRCALWAARRAPELRVAGASATAEGTGARLALNIVNKGKAGKLYCETTVRNAYSRTLSRDTQPFGVAPGKSTVTVTLDEVKLTGGQNFVEFRLLNDKGVVDFGAVILKQPRLALALHVDRTYGYTADPVPEATIQLNDALPPDARTVLSLEDANRRVVWEGEVTLAGATNTIPLAAVKRLEIPDYFARIRILQNGRVLAEASRRALYEVPVQMDDWLFGVCLYAGYYNTQAKRAYAQMRAAGVRIGQITTTGVDSAVEARSAMLVQDIANVMHPWRIDARKFNEQINKYQTTGDTKYLARDPDSNDPEFRARQLAKIKAIAPYQRALGIWDVCIIDEFNATKWGGQADFSFSEHTIEKFRAWARTQYKDLAELNEAYGRDYASWDEVAPLTIEQARKAGKFAGWVDHRRFMELTSCEYWSWAREELRKINPAATISLEGTQAPTPYNGHDVWLRVKTFDHVWSYHGAHQGEMMRSFGSRKPGFFDITWTGYGGTGIDRYHHWSRALDGGTHGVAYWWFLQVLNPDFQISPSAREHLEMSRELREGVGQLLIGRRLETSGIAIHYSQASSHSAYARNALPAWTAARYEWVRIVKHTGRQMDFLSYEELENGELSYPKWKVLILPYSVAMSDREIEAVRGFVKAGGTVIADAQAAVTDQHGRERVPSGLDDVFGIRHMNSDVATVSGMVDLALPRKWEMETKQFRVKLAEPAMVLDGGKPMIKGIETPGWVRNAYGKGHAYYFNSKLEYRTMKHRGEHRHILEAAENIFNEAGAHRPIQVTRDGSPWLEDVFAYHYREGDQAYLGLLSPTEKEKKDGVRCTVTLPADVFVHEMVEGRDRGRVRTFDVEMPRGDARLFAMLPRRTTALDATITPSVKQGGIATLSYEVKDGGNAGLRVVRVTVTGPDGKPVYRLEKNIKTADGKGGMEMPFALNDPTGEYTVDLREIAAGLTGTLTFTVTPAERLAPVQRTEEYPVPPMPKDAATWQGALRQHIEWIGVDVEEKPLPIEKSILVNPTALERAPDGMPKNWGVHVRRAKKWIINKDAMDYIRISEDKEVLFRGRPTTRIEIGHPDYPNWEAFWGIVQNWAAAKVKDWAGKTIKVRFFTLRTDGPEKPREYDAILRLRFWREGTFLGGSDATAACFKNVWTEATCETRIPSDADQMDATLFGRSKDPLRFHGFLIEVAGNEDVGL